MNKEEIIVNYSKNDFRSFIESDNTGIVLSLFDEEGCKLLKSSGKIADRITYLLSYSRYRNELFNNKYFLDTFLSSDITNYYACLKNLDDKTYDLLVEACYNNPNYRDKFPRLISYFNEYYLLKMINNWQYPLDYLYDIVRTYDVDIVNAILAKPGFDLSDKRLNIRMFIDTVKENNTRTYKAKQLNGEEINEVIIPVSKLTNEFYKRIWDEFDIFTMRFTINDADYCFDTTALNHYVGKREDEVINSFNEGDLFKDYKEIYESFEAIIKSEEMADEIFYNKGKYASLQNNEEYINLRMKGNMFHSLVSKQSQYMLDEIEEYYRNRDKEGMYAFLQKKSEHMLSNYIIDYHFRENYHNVMLDMQELLNFYYSGNINLPQEKVSIYDRVLNIDQLSTEEKKILHNEMKNINMMEMFYDDMLYSRRLVGELLRDNSLSKESIQEYRDDKLSDELGVDVYKIEDNPFFAIVKTGRRLDELPTGHSFSLVGHGGISVFGDVKDANTFVYDASELNPDQVVHIFPFDSFTLYKPYSYNARASTRVNMLMTPDELMYQTKKYSRCAFNEILLLEQGRDSMDIDKSIPLLKQIALYCVDEIRKEDIDRAKEQGVGIFLVNSSNYFKGFDANQSIYRHNVEHWSDDYFLGVDEGKFENKR